MRFGIFSDLHADLAAARRALDTCRALGAERLVCLGDLVGYGREPAETVALVRASGAIVLRGNHDHALGDDIELAAFNPLARERLLAHRRLLGPADRDWLAALPLVHREAGAVFTHASLPSPERFRYLTSNRSVIASQPGLWVSVREAAGELLSGEVLFVGHTHIADLLVERAPNDFRRAQLTRPVRVESPARAICNVGSASEARSGHESLVLFDAADRTVHFHRL